MPTSRAKEGQFTESIFLLKKLPLGTSSHAFQTTGTTGCYPRGSLFFCVEIKHRKNDGGWDMIAIAPDGMVSRACSMHFYRRVNF